MLIKVSPEAPEPEKIREIVKCLNNDGVIIFPTDTIYGLGCSVNSTKAMDQIGRIKYINTRKEKLAFLFADVSQASEYILPLDKNNFRMLKKNLPGPFTFIFQAGNAMPKHFKNNRKTLGVRVPDNKIPTAICAELGFPLLSTSLKSLEDLSNYYINPDTIHEEFSSLVDMVVDGGFGNIIPSTVVDCTTGEPEIIREGSGELEYS